MNPLVCALPPRTLMPEVLAAGGGEVIAVPATMRAGVRSESFNDGVGTGLAFISLPLAAHRALVAHAGHVATHLLGHRRGNPAIGELGTGAVGYARRLLGVGPEGLHGVFHLQLLRSHDRYCTNFSPPDQEVRRQRVREISRTANRVPPPLDDQHTLARETILVRSSAAGVVKLQPVGA